MNITTVSNKAPCDDATDLGSMGSAGLNVNDTLNRGGFYRDLDLCGVVAGISRLRVFSFIAEADGPMMATVKAESTMKVNPQSPLQHLARLTSVLLAYQPLISH